MLEVDPELGLRVPAADIAEARLELTARVTSLPCGAGRSLTTRRTMAASAS